jgi:UrcA family protein
MTKLATKILLLGGLAGLAAAGAAGAAGAAAAAGASPVSNDAPALVVRFSADMLATDSGARALYRRLAQAAEQVCPQPSETRLVREVVVKCREQAIAGAVDKIHNQRLAAIHAAASSKSSG